MHEQLKRKTRHDWRDFYDEYWSLFWSQCADSDWDDRDPQNIEESFQQWLCDEGLIVWDRSDLE